MKGGCWLASRKKQAIANCNAYMAKIMGNIEGLKFEKNKGINLVVLEVDSNVTDQPNYS